MSNYHNIIKKQLVWGEIVKKKFSKHWRMQGGVQGVQTPALLFRCRFLKKTYFENMSLRFLAEQGAS